jgi:hypothetical protein
MAPGARYAPMMMPPAVMHFPGQPMMPPPLPGSYIQAPVMPFACDSVYPPQTTRSVPVAMPPCCVVPPEQALTAIPCHSRPRDQRGAVLVPRQGHGSGAATTCVIPGFIEVYCDRMTGLDGNRVCFEGDVKMVVQADREPVEITAERVIVNLSNRTYEVNPGTNSVSRPSKPTTESSTTESSSLRLQKPTGFSPQSFESRFFPLAN